MTSIRSRLRAPSLRRGSRVLGALALAWLVLVGAAALALRMPSVDHVPGYPEAARLLGPRPGHAFAPLSDAYIRQRLGTQLGAEPLAPRVDRHVPGAAAIQGVTAEEITVVVYFDHGTYGTGAQQETTPPPGTFVDVDKPALPACASGAQPTDPKACDHVLIRVLRGFSRYLNSHYQTYNRHVHYWAYFSDAFNASARTSDALEISRRLHPFAAINAASFGGYNEEFDRTMTELGVVNFDSTQTAVERSFYRGNAPFSWGYWPDIEHSSRMYSSYVCTRVAPFPVKHYGNPPGVGAPNGQRRALGVWHPTPSAHPGLAYFTELVTKQLRDCGANVVESATYSREGYAVDAGESGVDSTSAVLRFAGRVTTVLYIGTEGRFATAADAARYYPEIVVAGNLQNDNNFIGQTQNANVWQNAWAMTYQARMTSAEDSAGARAYIEGGGRADDAALFFARERYPDHLMLFEAISAAGENLSPTTVSRGLHRIPPPPSSSPYMPAFFFEGGDYTAVKDAAEQWWDPQGRSPGGGTPGTRPGCWRMPHGGRRFLAGRWIKADDVFDKADDPCTGFGGSIAVRTG